VGAECRDFIYKNSVRTSQETHYVSTTKTNRLMLFGETVAVYCENHTEHINTLSGQSESELLYDWRFTANQFALAPSPLRLTARIFSQLNSCGHSPYITSSLTREWVCHLQLLLALARAFILNSRPYFTVSDSKLPFLSPPTTRRATVEIFDPASTREYVGRMQKLYI
jgi:hypothetical protein